MAIRCPPPSWSPFFLPFAQQTPRFFLIKMNSSMYFRQQFKKIIHSFYGLTLVLFLLIQSETSHSSLRVLIDPGHGGVDHGASAGRLVESEITLSLALRLKQLLAEDSRFAVFLTRSENKTVSLQTRKLLTEKYQADILISIHGNSSPEKKAQGLEIYFQNQNTISENLWALPFEKNQSVGPHVVLSRSTIPTETDQGPSDLKKSSDIQGIISDLKKTWQIKKSYQLAEHIQDEWPGVIKQAPFYVISQTEIPSLLIEVGFLSHPQEGPLMAQESFQRNAAERIYKALLKYYSYSSAPSISVTQNSIKN